MFEGILNFLTNIPLLGTIIGWIVDFFSNLF